MGFWTLEGLFEVKITRLYDRRASRSLRSPPPVQIRPPPRGAAPGQGGHVGYEINFNRFFYRSTPPWSLEAIEADIRANEQDIVRMLAEVTASNSTGK